MVVACVASVSNRVIARKLERKQKKGSFIPLPLPRHSFFFCSCPSFLDEPRKETLATQATMVATFLDHNSGEKDGDDNENGKKAIGLYQKNNNFAHASHFFVYFLAIIASLRDETS